MYRVACAALPNELKDSFSVLKTANMKYSGMRSEGSRNGRELFGLIRIQGAWRCLSTR